MDLARVEKASLEWKKKKADLDARLSELQSRREALESRLEELVVRARPLPVLRGDPDAPPARFPSGREEELDHCLQILRLRCQVIAEELVEVMLLAEALYTLARPEAGASPVAVSAQASGGPAAGEEGGVAGPAPAAPPRVIPSAASAPAAAGGTQAAPAAGSQPPAPAAASQPPPAQALQGPAPGLEGLASLISSPQFQKVAAQLLAQFMKK